MPKLFFIPPREQVRMRIPSRGGLVFELAGSGCFVSLRAWVGGQWETLSVVGNHAPGWRLLSAVMDEISEAAVTKEATNGRA